MSNERAADGAENSRGRTALCNEAHRVRFFCRQCNRFSCGDCFTLAHRKQYRDHEAEVIGECLEREDAQVDRQMEELSRLAENAEAAANARDQRVHESIDALTQLITEVERLLMISESTRETQELRRINRYCVAMLQQVDKSRRSVDPESDPVSALELRRNINSFLEEKLVSLNLTNPNFKFSP